MEDSGRLRADEIEARDVAAAIVTAVLGGDYREAQVIALTNDHVFSDVILALAGVIADQVTPEEWSARLLAIAVEDGR